MLRILSLVGLIVASGAHGQEGNLSVNSMRHAAAKAGWEATEVPAGLSTQRLASFRGGAIEESASMSAAQVGDSEAIIESELPVHWDWRQAKGRNFLSSNELAQGECGSCVAFAMATTLEATLNIACDRSDEDARLSRQHLFSCGGGSCSSGWRISSAVRYLESTGIPDEPCFFYEASDGKNVSCNQTCNDYTERSVLGVSSTRPTTGFVDNEKIKRAVMKGPVLANLILYEDLQYYKSGVYRHVSGSKLGGHAVSIVGWDDSSKAWIVRNSWGSKWGDGGYFKAAYDDPKVLLGRYTWLFNVSDAVSKGACAKTSY